MVRQALDLKHGIVCIEPGHRVKCRWVGTLFRWKCQKLIFENECKETVQLFGMVRDGQRAGCHDASKEALQTDLANKVNEVGRESEWHAPRRLFKILCFNLLHFFSVECMRRLVAQLKSRLTEAEAARALAEAHRRQGLQLRLVEGIREERVRCVVRCEPLFEQEEVIDIVEDPV